MPPAAVALILAAAGIHASWNLLVKRVGGGPPFVWLFSLASSVIYLPLAAGVYLYQRPTLGSAQWLFLLGSGVLQVVYFLLLQHGYRVGDLSVVYPLARGTGPLLSTVGAIVLLGERPGPLALIGALLIIGGVFLVAGGPALLSNLGEQRGVHFGLMIGAVIATYTLWDKHAVSALAIPPLLLNWAQMVFLTLALAPVAAREPAALRRLWRDERRAVIIVGLFSPLSYVMVLTALTFTAVSYVAPAREISILIGTFLGARMLSEGQLRQRLVAAAIMVAGILLLVVA